MKTIDRIVPPTPNAACVEAASEQGSGMIVCRLSYGLSGVDN